MNFKILRRYFEQSASGDEKETIHQWISRSHSRKSGLEKMHTIWDESKHLGCFDDIDVEADWQKVEQKLGIPYIIRHRAVSLPRFLFRIAAVVLLCFGLCFGLIRYFKSSNKQPDYYSTIESLGQIKSVKLPDGSVVTINTHSAIWFNGDFNHKSRDIILQGEAYFEVEHNPELPFRVFTGNSVVEVTGTRFSICEDTAFIRVMVLAGSVSFQLAKDPTVSTIVLKDESGYMYRDNTIKKQQEANINNISWKTGQLIFHKAPVGSALEDIAHHFHKELSIEATLNDSLTAQFTDQSLDDIMEELSLLTSLSIDVNENIIVVKQ
jgi:transmembrane sensor